MPHTLRHLPLRTLNDVQQNKHEKNWLLFVRAKDAPGLALVPGTSSAVDKRRRKKLYFTHKQMNNCKAPCPRMRSDIFSLEDQEEKLALR